MQNKKQPQNMYILPTNGSLWTRSLTSTCIGSICLFLLIPVMEAVLDNPEYYVGPGQGYLQARVFVAVAIFAPIFFVLNGLVTILVKNFTKKNIKEWGDMALEDEDTHPQV